MVFPEAFGVSLFSKWLACIGKKKEKVFDLLGTSLESEKIRKYQVQKSRYRKSLRLATNSKS